MFWLGIDHCCTGRADQIFFSKWPRLFFFCKFCNLAVSKRYVKAGFTPMQVRFSCPFLCCFGQVHWHALPYPWKAPITHITISDNGHDIFGPTLVNCTDVNWHQLKQWQTYANAFTFSKSCTLRRIGVNRAFDDQNLLGFKIIFQSYILFWCENMK